MNNDSSILITLWFLLESGVIWLVCFFFSSKIISRTKFIGEKKTYLRVSIANIICFLFFLIYGLLDKYYGVTSKILAPLWYLLLPTSLLFGLIFLYLFFSTKNRKERTQSKTEHQVQQRCTSFKEAVKNAKTLSNQRLTVRS